MTEEITGIDLVQAQIRVAGGAALSTLGISSQVSLCHVTLAGYMWD